MFTRPYLYVQVESAQYTALLLYIIYTSDFTNGRLPDVHPLRDCYCWWFKSGNGQATSHYEPKTVREERLSSGEYGPEDAM